MSILENIQAARKQALIDKDSTLRTTLTTLFCEITTKEKIEGHEPTDKDAIKALTKFLNSAKENRGYASDFNDPVRFNAFHAEVALYESFLPVAKPQLSDETLKDAVRSVIAWRLAEDTAKPKMGVVINDIKAKYEGQYDPKALTPIVKAELEAIVDQPKAQ